MNLPFDFCVADTWPYKTESLHIMMYLGPFINQKLLSHFTYALLEVGTWFLVIYFILLSTNFVDLQLLASV